MGVAREPAPVKIVVGLLAADGAALDVAAAAVADALGAIDLRSAAEAWRWSDYYRAEMGVDLLRGFAALAELRCSDELAALKEETNRLEQELSTRALSASAQRAALRPRERLVSDGGGDPSAERRSEYRRAEQQRGDRGAAVARRVNIDPGYVDVDKLVLASTKAAAHRVHLGRGIHAECALRFEDGHFQPWSYTYPDYCTPAALAFFTRVRRRLKQQRRAAQVADRRAR